MLSQMRDGGVDQRRLAGARRAGEADDEGVAEVRLQSLQQRRRGSREPLEFGDRACDGAPLSGPHALDGTRNIRSIDTRNGRRWGCGRLGHDR